MEFALGPGDVPIDRRLGEVLERDPLDRDGLSIEGVFGVLGADAEEDDLASVHDLLRVIDGDVGDPVGFGHQYFSGT